VDEHPTPPTGVGLALARRGPGGRLGIGVLECPHDCRVTTVAPRLPQAGELPGTGRPDGDPARTGTTNDTTHQQQPGVEDRCGIRALDVLEEGRVDGTGRVVEGEEDDAATRADGRGLRRDLDPRDPHLAVAARAEQVPAADHTQGVEHRPVELDDVRRRVEPEDVELGTHPLGAGHLGQPGAGGELGPVAEVEGELDRLVLCSDDRARAL